ncbi:MAG TPA: reverse transcriptase domain-containing protein, partial [Nitrospira sp.]|nr:reverse transcriptase domain-containing protein [Nitrospira sp.]
LKLLNKFIITKHFKMETLASVMESLRPQEYTASIDLEDAYLHIPMHPDVFHLFRFEVAGVVYQFEVLPFGIATAPHLFTKMMRPILGELHRQGAAAHAYIDDWLLRDASPDVLVDNVRKTFLIFKDLGVGVNQPKSRLEPARQFQFLGATLDLDAFTAKPSPERVANIVEAIESLAPSPMMSARALCQIIGQLDSAAALVPMGRWRVRPFHWFRHRNWIRNHGYEVLLVTSLIPRNSLRWWADEENLLQGVPVHDPQPELHLFTDASMEGWGGYVGAHVASGLWSNSETELHINVLELRAVFLSLERLLPFVTDHVVAVMSDNTTTVAYPRRGGGTHSHSLHQEVSRIFELCLEWK